jgi:hypothetical protein
MKLSGSEIENIFETLQSLKDVKFDIQTGYDVANLIKEMQPKYRDILNKKDVLIKQYGDKDEEGKIKLDAENKAHIAPEFANEVQKQLNEIYDEIYNLDSKYLQTSKLEGIELTLKQITNLMPILDK